MYGLPSCSWVQSYTGKSYMLIFSFFFLQYLQYHGLLRSRNFATMATWRNDFFSLLAYKRQGVVVRVPRKYWPEVGIFDVRKYLAAILCSFFTNWPWCYTSKDWLIFPFKAVIHGILATQKSNVFLIVHNVMNTLKAMTKTSPTNKMSLGSHGIVCGEGGGGGGEREGDSLPPPPPHPTPVPRVQSRDRQECFLAG